MKNYHRSLASIKAERKELRKSKYRQGYYNGISKCSSDTADELMHDIEYSIRSVRRSKIVSCILGVYGVFASVAVLALIMQDFGTGSTFMKKNRQSGFPGPFLSSLCLLGTGASSHRQDSVAAGITTTLLCSGRKNVRPFLERTTFTKSQGRSQCCGNTFCNNRRLAFSIILHEMIITFIVVIHIPVGDRIIHC